MEKKHVIGHASSNKLARRDGFCRGAFDPQFGHDGEAVQYGTGRYRVFKQSPCPSPWQTVQASHVCHMPIQFSLDASCNARNSWMIAAWLIHAAAKPVLGWRKAFGSGFRTGLFSAC